MLCVLQSGYAAVWFCVRSGRKAILVALDQRLRPFVPAAFEKAAGVLVDAEVVRACLSAGAGPAARAAGEAVFAVPAFFVMVDAVAHLYEAHVPIVGIRQDLGKRLLQRGFKHGVDGRAAQRHAGQDLPRGGDVHAVLHRAAGEGPVAALYAGIFLEGYHDPARFLVEVEVAAKLRRNGHAVRHVLRQIGLDGLKRLVLRDEVLRLVLPAACRRGYVHFQMRYAQRG